jgi:HD-like signal output (HDOD) protein
LSTQLERTPAHVAFEFVRSLAAELSSGTIDLPSFPEIAVRVRRILADPNSTVEQVVRVVGSEPALAARLLRIANSASMNRTGRPVNDLRTAVSRLGYNVVRSASIAFSMAQIRKSSKLKGLEQHLGVLWERSSAAAAFAYVLARVASRVSPDEAMLAGMMHGIGKMYVLTRAVSHPELFAEPDALEDVVAQWHAPIGKAILENWKFSEAMVNAVGDQEELEREIEGPADLTDVVAVALIMVDHEGDASGLEATLEGVSAATRLELSCARINKVLNESAAEVSALSQALGV